MPGSKAKGPVKKATVGGAPTPLSGPVSQLRQDLEGMNLVPSASGSSSSSAGEATPPPPPPPAPVTKLAKEKILAEVCKQEKDEKPVLSLVVVGASVPACFPRAVLTQVCDRPR